MTAFIEINTVIDGCSTIRLDRIESIRPSQKLINDSGTYACDIELTNGAQITVTEEYQEFLDRLAQIAPWISIVE